MVVKRQRFESIVFGGSGGKDVNQVLPEGQEVT